LSLFHHIHHKNGKHAVHHCGGGHVKFDPKLDYSIKHCKCGKHTINEEYAIGHATDKNLESIEVKIKFTEKCPCGGWHVESGILAPKN
ncbi:MAG: hypothetical protein KKA43_08065, partial [Nanoarchaeota archaeon]|nr:hypothetical protein [Nanoarchaeota archaeon]